MLTSSTVRAKYQPKDDQINNNDELYWRTDHKLQLASTMSSNKTFTMKKHADVKYDRAILDPVIETAKLLYLNFSLPFSFHIVFVSPQKKDYRN